MIKRKPYQILKESERLLLLVKKAMPMKSDLDFGEEVAISGDYSKIKIVISKEGGDLDNLSWLNMDAKGDGIWEVTNVRAVKKYGPLLYDLAMEVIKKLDGRGLMSDREKVSPGAQGIWKFYFENRSDVGQKELPENLKRSEVGEGIDYLNYYYWKDSTPILDGLISSGKLYSEDFNFGM